MRKTFLVIAALAAALATSLLLAGVATAKGGHLTAQLRGANEVPKAPVSNRGRAEIRLNAATGKVCWDFTITKIDGSGNAAHIHKGKPGVSGPVYIPLGTTFKRQGCTSAPKAKIRAVAAHPSTFYVNIHNAKHPAGAMRGQLRADL
jgi:CHRD domain